MPARETRKQISAGPDKGRMRSLYDRVDALMPPAASMTK